jgi:hypothetical protein
MTKRRFLPKFAAIVCAAAAIILIASHLNAWFFASPDEGSHVQRDFAQAGFSFTPAQRIVGAALEGLPKLAYTLAFFVMLQLLWSPRSSPAAATRSLSRASTLLLAGAIALILYPIPTSIAFSLLEPGDAGLFLLSLPLTVIVTVFGSLLFAATFSRIRDYLAEPAAD